MLTLIAAADALITNVVVTTHPTLNLQQHATYNFPASDIKKEPSFAFHLHAEQYSIQIKPTLAPSLIDRHHKLFVVVDTVTVLPALPIIPGHPVDPLHPLFELRLHPGGNRIDLEITAFLPPGSRSPGGPDFLMERWNLNAFLMGR